MGIIKRFFGRQDAARPPISEAPVANKPLSLQLLFLDKLDLEPAAVTRSLRAYHPTMARASCELDAQASKNGTPVGVLNWVNHVVRLIGFDAPMPAPVVEQCVQGAHYRADLKTQARAHRSHVILYYAGKATAPLEQYVALAAAAGALARHNAIVVVNEAGHTSLPAEVLAAGNGDTMQLLRSLPIPILYSGFVKFDVEGVQGVWMRTFGNHLLGLPDFAHLSGSHDEGQSSLRYDREPALLPVVFEGEARSGPYAGARSRHVPAGQGSPPQRILSGQ
jgi:hypothetical protein